MKLSRRDFLKISGVATGGLLLPSGAALASGGLAGNAVAAEEGSRAVKKEIDGKMTTTISLDWSEVYFTNCPMVSANNIDQEAVGARRISRRWGLITPISGVVAKLTGTRTTSTTRIT